jgi:hypothetical protein
MDRQEIPEQKQMILDLRTSSQFVGQLYPALLDTTGKIIDGKHRLEADPTWPTIEVKTVDSEEKRLLAMLIANVCRRVVSSEEKTEILMSLCRIYQRQGLRPDQLAKELSKKTGMTYRWVMKYLPSNLKMRPGVGGPRRTASSYKTKIEGLADKDYRLLIEPREKIASVTNYSNTKFATILLDRRFYLKLKEAASALGVNPSTIINNSLLEMLHKVETFAKEKSPPITMCLSK